MTSTFTIFQLVQFTQKYYTAAYQSLVQQYRYQLKHASESLGQRRQDKHYVVTKLPMVGQCKINFQTPTQRTLARKLMLLSISDALSTYTRLTATSEPKLLFFQEFPHYSPATGQVFYTFSLLDQFLIALFCECSDQLLYTAQEIQQSQQPTEK